MTVHTSPPQCSFMSPCVLLMIFLFVICHWHLLYTYFSSLFHPFSWHKPCPELRQPTVPTSHSPFIFLNVSLSSLKIITKTDVVNFSMIQLCIVHLQEWRKSQWSILCGQSPALVSCGWPVCGRLSLGPTCPQQATSGHRFCGMFVLALL